MTIKRCCGGFTFMGGVTAFGREKYETTSGQKERESTGGVGYQFPAEGLTLIGSLDAEDELQQQHTMAHAQARAVTRLRAHVPALSVAAGGSLHESLGLAGAATHSIHRSRELALLVSDKATQGPPRCRDDDAARSRQAAGAPAISIPVPLESTRDAPLLAFAWLCVPTRVGGCPRTPPTRPVSVDHENLFPEKQALFATFAPARLDPSA